MSLVDARGTEHRCHVDPATLRIVSLVPSLTELLCDLGLAPSIVGRTGFCIHPAGVVGRIAKVGGTKSVDVDRIRRLAPTHVVVNVDENEKPTVDAIAAFVPSIVVTDPRTPDDNVALYRLFGDLFDRPVEAHALCARFADADRALAARPPTPPQRVLYLIWKDPWMTVGRDTYLAAMLARIGWHQVDVADAIDTAVRSSPRYPAVDLIRAARQVDRVLLSSEPYRFTDQHVDALRGVAPRVQRVDGESLSWYGSRAIDTLAYLGRLAVT